MHTGTGSDGGDVAQGGKSLRNMIKSGLLNKKNKNILTRGGTLQDGVLVNAAAGSNNNNNGNGINDDYGNGNDMFEGKVMTKEMRHHLLQQRNLVIMNTSHDMSSPESIIEEANSLTRTSSRHPS